MVRGRDETSTSGHPGGRHRAKPSASNVIASLTMEELKVYCEVPDNIDLRLMERADDSTLGGAFSSRTALSRTNHSQTVFTFYPSAPSPYPLQCDSHPKRMLCADSCHSGVIRNQ